MGFGWEAFNLAAGDEQPVRVAEWRFPASENKQRWLGGWLASGFSLDCPWPGDAVTKPVTVRVMFEDALTGRTFTEQKVVE